MNVAKRIPLSSEPESICSDGIVADDFLGKFESIFFDLIDGTGDPLTGLELEGEGRLFTEKTYGFVSFFNNQKTVLALRKQ